MIKLQVLILTIVCHFKIIWGITDEEYAMMPPFYHTDDYDYCMKFDKALYCSIVFQLMPIDDDNNGNNIWNVIKNVSLNEKYYRHDKLRHHLCATNICDADTIKLFYEGKSDTFKREFSERYSRNFLKYDLKGTIIDMRCLEKGHRHPIGVYDLIVAFIIISIIFIVLISTYCDLTTNLEDKGVLVCFSLKNNINRLIDTEKEHQQQQQQQDKIFRSFEGVRFCIMYCVVVCHTGVLKASVPIANIDYLEKDVFDPLTTAIMHSTFIVVVYFAMTGMILGILFFDMIEKRPKLDVPYLIKGIFNRIFRLYPSLLIVILFTSTWTIHLFDGPFWHNLVVDEYTRCRNNGWTNLLFINNLYKKEDMCLIQTWYLAADIQMFIIVTVTLGFVWKYPRYGLRILIGASLIGTLINFTWHYYNKANLIVPKRIPENFQHTFLDMPEFHTYYTSPQSNFSVYPISLLFGYIYHKTKNVNVFKKKIYVYCWWFVVISIPVSLDIYGILINRPNYNYGRFEAAFYRSMERNFFVISSLTALYGFLKGQGSVIKSFLESSMLQMMGRLTYSTFLVHYVVIRIRLGTMRYPSYFAMIASFYESLGDFVASYLIGLVLCLFVEMPFVQIQKMIKKRIDKRTNLLVNNNIDKKSE